MASAIIAMQEAFLYTGQAAAVIPRNVTRIRVDPSVTRIPPRTFEGLRTLEEVELCEELEEIGERAFRECVSLRRIKIPSTVARILNETFRFCVKLEEVKLCEGVEEIGRYAFSGCTSLGHIHLPSTVRVIGGYAFSYAALSSIDLPDSLESIGYFTFRETRLQNMRIPSLITEIPIAALSSDKDNYRLFSVELPEGINRINNYAINTCLSLRNIAIPSNSVIENYAFHNVKDLEKLFVTESRIKIELKHRFDGLPIHKMMYYQSYHTAEMMLENLNTAIDLRAGLCRKLRSKLSPTGKLQDCLGMTPLHILACSSKQNLALYQVIVEKYPENLITEDKWGALPILYALWGNAPREIMQFLVESHHARYPSHELNWGKMMETLSIGSPLNTVKNLLDIQTNSFHVQSIEWDKVLVEVLVKIEETKNALSNVYSDTATIETYRFLLHYSISGRLNSIGVKQWRDIIVYRIKFTFPERTDRNSVYSILLDYETKYGELKEATSMLELVLWKKKIDESNMDQHRSTGRNRKKMKIDESGFRQQYRISCGAATVIENVLPYLV